MSYRSVRRLKATFACLFVSCTVASVAGYRAIILPTIGGASGSATGVANGQIVGNGGGALLWLGPFYSSYTTLDPQGYTSAHIADCAHGQQVGWATSAGHAHALIWQGNAQSVVDLDTPGGPGQLNSYYGTAALSTDGTTQVGYARAWVSDFLGNYYLGERAVLWHGSANTYVDLAGPVESQANDVDGGIQVGSGGNDVPLPVLWRGTRASVKVLDNFSPGYFGSANGISGNQIVGSAGPVPSLEFAAIWDANTLTGRQIGQPRSAMNDTNGTFQVGFVQVSGRARATRWSGVPGTELNLEQYLALPNVLASVANRIDRSGTIVGSVTIASGTYPVAWIPTGIN